MASHEQAAPANSLSATPGQHWHRFGAALLTRDLILVLLLKVALVLALYLFLFRPALHPAQDSEATAAAVTGSAATPHR